MKRNDMWKFFNRLGTQLLLLIGVSIFVAFLVSMAATVMFQRMTDKTARDQLAVLRVAELIEALSGLSETERYGFVGAASSRSTRVSISEDPGVIESSNDDRSKLLVASVKAETGLSDVTGAILSRTDEIDPLGDRNQSGNREVISLSIMLPSGQWLNFRSRDTRGWYSNSDLQFIAMTFAVTFILVVLVSGMFVRHIIAPVRTLANAAQSSAEGKKQIKVPETGPTELRDAAQAFNAMQDEITRFDEERKRTIAAVGHDLRTPLTSIRIYAEDIEDDSLRNRIIASLEQVTLMADGLVNYVKAGAEEELTNKVDLSALLKSLCEEADVPCSVPANVFVMGGQVSLTRAIRNVIENAINYGKDARVELEMDGPSARVHVKDVGSGIPTEDLSKVFDPFFRSEGSRNLETGGAGLGLSIAKEIVQAHDGAIRLQNQTTGGLSVEIELPLCNAKKPRA